MSAGPLQQYGQRKVEPRTVDLKQIYLLLTRRCNLSCTHCIRSSGPDVRDALSGASAIEVLERLKEHGRDPLVLLSGGEPTLHPDFEAIVDAASRTFSNVMVNTNGLNVDTLSVAALGNPKLRIQVSLDGDESAHDSIRGRGTFTRTLRAIQHLASIGARLTVATTVDSGNIDTLNALDSALLGARFERWTIKREVVYGRARPDQGVSTSAWNALVRKVRECFVNRSRIAINPMFEATSFRSGARRNGTQADMNCGTGRSKIYVNPDLTAFPCACMEDVVLGHLGRESASQVLRRLAMLPIEPASTATCAACPALALCGGGCPGASRGTFGQFGMGDPRCPAVQNFAKMSA